MKIMRIDVLPIGEYEENCYILHDEGHVLIVDPGRYAKVIAKVIDEKENVEAVVLTHGHSDHTEAVDDIVDLYRCPVFIADNDRILIDPDNRVRVGYSSAVYSEVTSYTLPYTDAGWFHLEIIETPGHTAGSVCIRYRNILFSGDTLFAGSVGRTDLYSGDESVMVKTLRNLMTLNNDLQVLPGHGPSTTIGHEKEHNPFVYAAMQK